MAASTTTRIWRESRIVDAACVRRWLEVAAARIESERHYLTQLDAAIGDADHGINMHRGFGAVLTRLSTLDGVSPGELMTQAGRTFVSIVGGAAGPLYGTAFVQAGQALGADGAFGPRRLLEAIRASLRGVQRVGAAVEGDKTMVDALAPGLAAFEAGLRHGTLEAAVRGASVIRTRAPPPPHCCSPRWRTPCSRSAPTGCPPTSRYPWERSMTGEPTMIQSVGRAARILKALGSEQARLGVTELAERLGLAKATVYGLLRTLAAHQFVEQDLETGKYRLGPALLQLGNAFLDNHELRARSLLWAESLASRAREAVLVGVLYGPNVLVVHHVFRPDDSVQILEVGASIPWHACALGKAMVAFLDPAARKEVLGQELARIARDGIAIEDQEAIIGEAGIAALLFDNHGAVVGAMGLAGPVEHLLPSGAAADVLAAVKEAARGLARELGAGRLSLPAAEA